MIGLCPEHGGFQGEDCPRCGAEGDPVLREERRVKLSKLLSGALRHFPEELDLELDAQGWTSLDALAKATRGRYAWATEGAVRAVIDTDPKGRFEAREGRVRAVYGHSVEVELGPSDHAAVPEVLYHATAPGNVDRILVQGLEPMDRNEVHLSPSREAALEVGRRHAEAPVLLAIDTERLTTLGFQVHARSEQVYTTSRVPPDCLDVVS